MDGGLEVGRVEVGRGLEGECGMFGRGEEVGREGSYMQIMLV